MSSDLTVRKHRSDPTIQGNNEKSEDVHSALIASRQVHHDATTTTQSVSRRGSTGSQDSEEKNPSPPPDQPLHSSSESLLALHSRYERFVTTPLTTIKKALTDRDDTKVVLEKIYDAKEEAITNKVEVAFENELTPIFDEFNRSDLAMAYYGSPAKFPSALYEKFTPKSSNSSPLFDQSLGGSSDFLEHRLVTKPAEQIREALEKGLNNKVIKKMITQAKETAVKKGHAEIFEIKLIHVICRGSHYALIADWHLIFRDFNRFAEAFWEYEVENETILKALLTLMEIEGESATTKVNFRADTMCLTTCGRYFKKHLELSMKTIRDYILKEGQPFQKEGKGSFSSFITFEDKIPIDHIAKLLDKARPLIPIIDIIGMFPNI